METHTEELPVLLVRSNLLVRFVGKSDKVVLETTDGAPRREQPDPLPDNSEMRQQTLWQIMIGEEVEGCDVQDTVDDGGAGECGSGV